MKCFKKIIFVAAVLFNQVAGAREYYEESPQNIEMIREKGVGAIYNWKWPNGSCQKVRVVSIETDPADGKTVIRMDPVDNIIIADFENEDEFTIKQAPLSGAPGGGLELTVGLGSSVGSAIAAGIIADSGLEDEINRVYQKIDELKRKMGEEFRQLEQAKINLRTNAIILKLKVDAILKTGIKPLQVKDVSPSTFNIRVDQGHYELKSIHWNSRDNDFRSQADSIRTILMNAKIKDGIDRSFFEISKSTLIEADQQNFLSHKEESDSLLKIARASADVLVGLDPFTGFARGVYEAFTGKNLITDELLTPAERTLSLIGAVGVGMAVVKIARSAGIIADIIAHLPIIGDASKKIFAQTQRILNTVKSFENDSRWILKSPEQIVSGEKAILKPTQEFLNPKIIDQKVSELVAGKVVKPIEVIKTPSGKYILDGHHRYIASKITGIKVPEIITEAGDFRGLPDWKRVTFFNFKVE